MSFGKRERRWNFPETSQGPVPLDAARPQRLRRAARRDVVQRRVAVVFALVCATVAAIWVLPPSSQATVADEPDLVPFVGSFSLGCTWDNGCGGGHHGASTPALDIPMPEGTAVVAAAPGVARVYEDSCAGRYIEIWHAGAQKFSRYLHLSTTTVASGTSVARGQVIGASGNTGAAGGCSSGPHLHFDVLNASRARVRPGPLTGRRNGAWVSYPQALGATNWSGVRAYSGAPMGNDFRLQPSPVPSSPGPSSPGPSSPGSTSTATTRPPVTTTPVTTAPPATTAPAPVTTTTRPIPPRTNLAPGTLFRPASAPTVFLFQAGNAWRVPTSAQVDLLGGSSAVTTVPGSLDGLLTAYPFRPLDHEAFMEAGNATVYWCAGGSPWPVSSMAEVNALRAQFGRSALYVLPAGAGRDQWACGATLAGTVVQARGRSDYWVWRGTSWEYVANASTLTARGYGGRPVGVIPASAVAGAPSVAAGGSAGPSLLPRVPVADGPSGGALDSGGLAQPTPADD